MKHLLGISLAIILGFTGTVTAQAETVTVAVGELPPHANARGEGREAEIIARTLEACGHTVTFQAFPFTRHWETYRVKDDIDAVATVPDGLPLPGHATNHYINFHNGVSVLADSGITASSLADLKGKRVIAFKGAEGILPGLKDAVDSFATYDERTDQIVQSRLLFGKRTDAVLGDGMIFAAYNKNLQNQHAQKALNFDPNQAVKFLAIFDPTSYRMMFKSAAIQQDFDRCYADLTTKGEIQAINQRYVDQYKETVGGEYKGL